MAVIDKVHGRSSGVAVKRGSTVVGNFRGFNIREWTIFTVSWVLFALILCSLWYHQSGRHFESPRVSSRLAVTTPMRHTYTLWPCHDSQSHVAVGHKSRGQRHCRKPIRAM